MKKEIVLTGAIGLLAGLLIAPSIFGPRVWNALPGWGFMEMSGGVMGGVMRDIDSHFIEEMIPHHNDAILMAEIALRRAERREIRQLAEGIIRAQSEENEIMRGLYRSWYGLEVPDNAALMGHGPGMMHGGMMGGAADVSRFEAADPFEKEFIEQMIPHHQMAIMMAQMLLRGTERSEMKRLAEDIINAQSREIAEMRRWYADWYGL